jgi:uncharacterized membrane protein YciS (DUF1049 family)
LIDDSIRQSNIYGEDSVLRIINWIVFSLIFCISVILTVPNANQIITLHYWLGSVEVNVAVLLFAILSLGIFLGTVFNLSWVWKLRENNKALKKQYQQTLQQLDTVVRSEQDVS